MEASSAPTTNISSYIKVIGRGKDGARSLTADQAHELFGAVLDKSANDLQIGAFLLAMRIKSETNDELLGFVRASEERCLPIDLAQQARPAVVLPSYNGARKLPNFTALLAALLAREGVPVLVHGPRTDPGRVTTAQVFEALDWPLATSAADVQQAWSAKRPAFMPIDVLCPAMSALLDVRWTIGLRGPGHTVVKLMSPCVGGRSLRVVSYTHPEYAATMASVFDRFDTTALLLRGTEGEPVADARRTPRMVLVSNGQARCVQQAQQGALTTLPRVPTLIDAATTADFSRAVMEGRLPAPNPIVQQVEHIVRACKMLEASYDRTLLQPLVSQI